MLPLVYCEFLGAHGSIFERNTDGYCSGCKKAPLARDFFDNLKGYICPCLHKEPILGIFFKVNTRGESNTHMMENNRIHIEGTVESVPEYSHHLYGEAFYTLRLSVGRLSGVKDILPVTISDRLLPKIDIGDGLSINGQLRSYNKQSDGASRLIITAFARYAERTEEIKPHNEVVLNGFICKPVIYRTTPFEREIADILIAVNRAYNKSDYLPCIAWGRNARYAGTLNVGDAILLNGRLQSREYQKRLPNGEILTRTAYEVSASTLEPVDAAFRL